MGVKFPSLKPSQLKRLLLKLGYVERPDSGKGSHCWLDRPGHPSIRWAFHDRDALAPIEVKKVLMNQAGLTLEQAKEVVGI